MVALLRGFEIVECARDTELLPGGHLVLTFVSLTGSKENERNRAEKLWVSWGFLPGAVWKVHSQASDRRKQTETEV